MRRVNMYVDQPSCIKLHVREKVRLDRLQPTAADEYVAERHGALLAPGVTELHLDTGIYHFRTLEDAQLRVLAGGVRVDTAAGNGKDPWPPPPPPPPPLYNAHTASAAAPAVWAAVAGLGYGPCGRVPALTVVDATVGAA